VFNREVVKKNAKPGELSNFNKKTGRFEQNGGWQKRKFRGNLNTDLDEHGCPIQKIALLVGPPGLAKTTLAHVIAKHAGYAVIERNASDDRQLESFRQTLENCTQMTSVLNTENRPNCIILDEIDGAPAPSVEYLVRFATGQIAEKGKKNSKGKRKMLKRPIICICNDLYGANLRQLRQIAFVVNFQSIDTARLAERLFNIANREHIKTDMTALLTMVEKSGGDIRSCLSMLQFYASKKQPLTLFDVLNSNIGQKDQHKSLFTAWSSIFQIQRPKKIIKNSDSNGRIISNSDMSIRTRMVNVLDTINSCGEYEKLAQGVHENFLKQKIHDNIDGVVEACHWFSFNDRVQHKINSLQNYVMYPYLQYAFVSWHFIFASLAYPQISYPQKQYEVMQKLITVKQIFNSLRKGIANASLKGIGCGSEIIIDTISLLKLIINPEIRSVSMHLLTDREKNELQHTVEIIADFGLTFVQLQAGDGTYTYRCEPDIDFFQFTGMPQRQISYWSKQMIANEVEVEKMRRSRPKVEICENIQKVVEKKDEKESPTSDNKKLPNHLQRLIPKAVKSNKSAQVVCKDFFGRIITKPSVTAGASGSAVGAGGECEKILFLL
jgi:chromosome transmission fidelity protein 18